LTRGIDEDDETFTQPKRVHEANDEDGNFVV
jgi:hypothetical protein